MYSYHPENTQVPSRDLVTQSFVAGLMELFEVVRSNPNLRMVHIKHYAAVHAGLRQLGYRARLRYRGPHGQGTDTHRADARAFTVYFK